MSEVLHRWQHLAPFVDELLATASELDLRPIVIGSLAIYPALGDEAPSAHTWDIDFGFGVHSHCSDDVISRWLEPWCRQSKEASGKWWIVDHPTLEGCEIDLLSAVDPTRPRPAALAAVRSEFTMNILAAGSTELRATGIALADGWMTPLMGSSLICKARKLRAYLNRPTWGSDPRLALHAGKCADDIAQLLVLCEPERLGGSLSTMCEALARDDVLAVPYARAFADELIGMFGEPCGIGWRMCRPPLSRTAGFRERNLQSVRSAFAALSNTISE